MNFKDVQVDPGLDYFMARKGVRPGAEPNCTRTLYKMYLKLYDQMEMGGFGYHKLTFREFLRQFRELGYNFSWRRGDWGPRGVVFLRKRVTPVTVFKRHLPKGPRTTRDEFGDVIKITEK